MHEQFMQLVSTFVYVHFKDVSAPLESVSYCGTMRGILKKKRDKASKTKKKKSKQLGQIQTQYQMIYQQII